MSERELVVALAKMVALWEATFDEERRCRCSDPPTHLCAYCVAKELVERGQLTDARLIGRA